MKPADLKFALARLQLIRHDKRGQDLIEYALLAGAVAMLVYGALPTAYADSLSTIWSRVNVQLNRVN